MIDVVNLKEMPECIMELGRGIEILSSQNMTSSVFPESLDYIEIRRIRRQEYEVDSEFGRRVLYCLTMLVTRVVKDYGDRCVARCLPYLFQKGFCLVGIHINHGMGLYDVKREWIDTSEKIETVPSCSGLEVKRLLTPHMAGERLQCEMDGIHEIELAFTVFGLIYNRLQCGNPFVLFLWTSSARDRLCLYEPEAATMHYLPCPCQAEHNAADVPNNICGLGGTSGRFGFQSAGNLIHMFLQPTGTTRNGGDSENGIDSPVVIRMNHAVNEVAAASHYCSYALATQLRFRHFGHKGTTTFADDAGGSSLAFLFETGIRLLTIFDGEQCCIDNLRMRLLSINGVRRLLLDMETIPILHKYFMFYL